MERIEAGVHRPPPVTIVVDGHEVSAFPGESVASALLAGGRRAFRRSRRGDPRGPFCNMGVCFECVVTIGGTRVRACMTRVAPGLVVSTADNDADR